MTQSHGPSSVASISDLSTEASAKVEGGTGSRATEEQGSMDKRTHAPKPILPLEHGLFCFLGNTRERMTDMKPKKPDCPLHAGPSPRERISFDGRSIDSRTMQAFHHLRFHTEDLALELAVRLRVLGKSLAACPGQGAAEGKWRGGAVVYESLRRQLDGFLGSLVGRDFAGHHYFPVIRRYLQDSLPYELNGCASDEPCRIELVEAVISLLSESSHEDDAFAEEFMLSFS